MPHIGEFWAKYLKDQYPRVQHAIPIATSQPPYSDPLTGIPLPRVWMIAADDRSMVQLQQDRIYVNWRRRAPSDVYVRYPYVRDEFFRVARLLDEYLVSNSSAPTKPVRYELTYVNLIHQDSGDQVSAFEVLRDVRWDSTSRQLAQPLKLGIKCEFALPDRMGLLGVTSDPVRSGQGSGYRVQLAAVADAEVAARADYRTWVDVAHEQIVGAFTDLTTPKMHAVWGLEAGEA